MSALRKNDPAAKVIYLSHAGLWTGPTTDVQQGVVSLLRAMLVDCKDDASRKVLSDMIRLTVVDHCSFGPADLERVFQVCLANHRKGSKLLLVIDQHNAFKPKDLEAFPFSLVCGEQMDTFTQKGGRIILAASANNSKVELVRHQQCLSGGSLLECPCAS